MTKLYLLVKLIICKKHFLFLLLFILNTYLCGFTKLKFIFYSKIEIRYAKNYKKSTKQF